MLPSRPKNKLPSQLNEEISDESKKVKKERVRANPLPAYLILVLSIIICLSFWGYTTTKKLVKNPPTTSNFQFKPNFPNLSLIFQNLLPQPKVVNNRLDSTQLQQFLDSLLQADLPNWSILVNTYPPETSVFSYNPAGLGDASISTIYQQLADLPATTDSTLLQSLPEGSQIQQIYQEHLTSADLYLLVTVPKKQLGFYIRAQNQANLDKLKQKLPALVQTLYWSFI